MTYEQAEKLALRAIHDEDGRGMIGRSRLHLHQRVARAILAATSEPQPRAPQVEGEGSRDENQPFVSHNGDIIEQGVK